MTHFLIDISPTFKVLAVFILIVVALKFRIPLGLAMVAGAVAIGFWFGMRPLAIVKSLALSVVDETTLMLVLAIALILLLSESMSRTGQLLRIVNSFRKRFSHYKLSLATFPALIGLLPMPGGAYFSAPMVETVGKEDLSPERKTAINHWFRHIWEYCWPLYPGVIVGSALSDLSTGKFVLAHIPVTLITIGLGYAFLLTRLGRVAVKPAGQVDAGSHFLREVAPITIIIVTSVVVGTAISLAGRAFPAARLLPDRTSLAIALGAGVLWVWRKSGMTAKDEMDVILNKRLRVLVLTILGVMTFRQLLTDSGAVTGITESMASRQIPMMAISIFLPFFVGMITGVTVAFLGTTFPILMALLAAQGLREHLVSFTVLAYCSGFIGTFLSPVHLCLILTKEYFKSDWLGIYKLLILPSLLTIVSALGLYFLYLRIYH
jgi:integral membrane protein (TIGR00529 family)